MKVVGMDKLTGFPIFESEEDLNELQVCKWLNGAYRQVKSLKEHDSALLDKVAEKFISWDSKVKKTREDGVCFFTIENILQVIAGMKAEVQKGE